jgi:putative oxidoreductase
MLDTFAPLLSLAGRLLLALLFIQSGPPIMMSAQDTAATMAGAGLPSSALLAVAIGAFELVGGLFIAIGVKTRWTALALALFTLVASLKFHAYWAAPADQQFVQQLLFMKNIAVAGALLFVAGTGAGAWSWEGLRAPRLRFSTTTRLPS